VARQDACRQWRFGTTMTLCVIDKGHCMCNPDEGVFCPNYKPDAYVQYLMDAITELLKKPHSERSAEVRLNDDKTLDEVVTKDGDQLEQMDYNHWFLQIADVAVWLHAKGKITASYEHRPTAAGHRHLHFP
jgi:hypothetical protein